MTRDIEDRLTDTFAAVAEQVTEDKLTMTAEDMHIRPRVVDLSLVRKRNFRWIAPALAAASVVVVVAGAAVVHDLRSHKTNPTPASSGTALPTPAPSITTGETPTASNAPTPNATPSMAENLLLRGSEEPGSRIPWSQVGSGWTVALWSPKLATSSPKPESADLTVYVVNPIGGRYRVTTVDGTTVIGGLAPDGRRLMVTSPDPTEAQSTRFTEIDLRTGAKTTISIKSDRPPAPAGFDSSRPRFIEYTKPKGTAMIVGDLLGQGTGLLYARYSLAGDKQYEYGTTVVGPYRADGATFAGTAADPVTHLATLALISNGGDVVRRFPTPDGFDTCDPVGWWSSVEIEATCTSRFGGSDVFLFNADTGAPTQLTRGLQNHDSVGYLRAVKAGTKTLLTSTGCGDRITELNANGTGDTLPITTPTHFPAGASPKGYELLSGTTTTAVLRTTACVENSPALVVYGLDTRTTTVLLGADLNGGTVTSVAAFD